MITVNNLGFTFTYLENFQESLPIDCLSRNHLKIGQPSCISHWKWIFRQKVKWILSPFLLHLNTFLRIDLLFWDSYNLCTILLLKWGFIFTVGKTAINPVKVKGKKTQQNRMMRLKRRITVRWMKRKGMVICLQFFRLLRSW